MLRPFQKGLRSPKEAFGRSWEGEDARDPQLRRNFGDPPAIDAQNRALCAWVDILNRPDLGIEVSNECREDDFPLSLENLGGPLDRSKTTKDYLGRKTVPER